VSGLPFEDSEVEPWGRSLALKFGERDLLAAPFIRLPAVDVIF